MLSQCSPTHYIVKSSFHQLQSCDIQPKDGAGLYFALKVQTEINVRFEQGYAQVASLLSVNSTSLIILLLHVKSKHPLPTERSQSHSQTANNVTNAN